MAIRTFAAIARSRFIYASAAHVGAHTEPESPAFACPDQRSVAVTDKFSYKGAHTRYSVVNPWNHNLVTVYLKTHCLCKLGLVSWKLDNAEAHPLT